MCSVLASCCSSEANSAHPTLRTSKAPTWGFQLLSPSPTGWEHLCCYVGFAELPKWGKKSPKERQGTQGEEPSPALHAPVSPLAVTSVLDWKRMQRLSSPPIKAVSNTQSPFVTKTREQSRTEHSQGVH